MDFLIPPSFAEKKKNTRKQTIQPPAPPPRPFHEDLPAEKLRPSHPTKPANNRLLLHHTVTIWAIYYKSLT